MPKRVQPKLDQVETSTAGSEAMSECKQEELHASSDMANGPACMSLDELFESYSKIWEDMKLNHFSEDADSND